MMQVVIPHGIAVYLGDRPCMPVRCGDCQFSVRLAPPDYSLCGVSTRNELRNNEALRLCSEFERAES